MDDINALSLDEIRRFGKRKQHVEADRHAARMAEDYESLHGRLPVGTSGLIVSETEERVRQEYMANQKRDIDNHTAIKPYKVKNTFRVEQLEDDYAKLGSATLRVEKKFYNLTSMPLLGVVDRTNIPISLRNRANKRCKLGLYVEIIYHLSPAAVPEDIGFMNNRDFKGVLTEAQKAAYCELVPNKSNRYSVVYVIPEEHLNLKEQHIYLEDLDLVIYIPDLKEQPIHPFSKFKDVKDREDALRFLQEDGFTYLKLIRYNRHDPNDNTPVYINSNGAVINVPVVSRPDIDEGVTVIENKASTPDSPNQRGLDKRFYDLKDIRKEGIDAFFDSFEEAVTLGNVKSLTEEARKRLELELNDSNAELHRLKNQIEKDQMELKIKENKVNEELDRKKIRLKKTEQKLSKKLMKAKNKHEHRSLKTKTTSDLLKYAPTILGGALTVAGIVLGTGVVKIK